MDGYDLVITLLINGAVTIFGGVIGYFIANQNYASQRIYDKKLSLISELYEKIIQLEFEIKKYVHFEGADFNLGSIQEKIDLLKKLKENFQKFQHKFWEIEIFLDDEMSLKINEFLKLYIEITSKLGSSLRSQQQHNSQEAYNSWEESFNKIAIDLLKLKSDLKKDFKGSVKKINK